MFLGVSSSLTVLHAPDDVVQRDGADGGADAGPAQRARVATPVSHLLQTAGAEGVATAESGGPVERLQTDWALQLLRETRGGRRSLLGLVAPLARLLTRLAASSVSLLSGYGSVPGGAGGSCSSVDLQRDISCVKGYLR